MTKAIFLMLALLAGASGSAQAAIAYHGPATTGIAALPYDGGTAGPLTINRPGATATGDVLIATISARPSVMTISPPAGWILVRRTEQPGGGVSTQPGGMTLLTYSRVVANLAAEPASYTWSLLNTTVNTLANRPGAAGGIMAFGGVDQTAPVNVEGGNLTASGLVHTANAITTTVANTMLVSSITYLSASSFGAPTGPAGIVEALDVSAPTVANVIGLTLQMAYAARAAAGSTGAVSATATGANADTGVGHMLALKPPAAPAAPTVTTNAATSVAATGATLNGTGSSNGASTTVTFDYGLTVAYGSSATATQSPLAAGASGTAVSAAVSGLTCNTLYHFRVKGVNSAGTTNGGDRTFTTSACVPQVTVTPATGGGAIASNTAPGCALDGTWTTLTGPAIAETVAAQIGLGTIVLSAPSGFEFNTAAAVRILLTGDATKSRNINNLATGTLIVPSVTATTITFTVTAVGTRVNTLTWQSIQVRPTAATPLAAGNITHTGTSPIAGVTAATNLGTLTEVTSVPACKLSAPTTTKSFVPASIAANGTSTLTIAITNPNTAAISGLAFTDTYPSTNLKNATTPALTNTCGGTATGTAGASVLSLSGGTLPASSSCSVSVSVTPLTEGSYLNSTGAVTSTNADSGTAASATLTVTAISAANSTVVANPTSVVADNSATSLITVTLRDGAGNGVSGKTVTLAAGSGNSTISAASGPSNASGVVTFTVKDGTAEGPITYTATDTTDSIVITQTAQVTFTAPVLCFTDSFAGTLGANWSVGRISGSFTPANVSGRLRLTDATTGQATWATLQQSFPAAGNKATVEFEHFAYGGTGADGIAVVFSDASEVPVAGAFGGSLGYAQKSNPGSDCVIVGGCPGFAGGWLGVALDEYGNFSNPTEGRYGGTGFVPDSVSIRGSGTGVSGYRFLQGTATLSPGVDGNNVPPGTVAHRYRIIIDHKDSVHAYVSVERDTTSGVGTAYTNLIAPFDVKDPGYSQSAIPVSFNLSFTGSTGASTNIHEIRNLSVCTGLAMVVPTLHHIEIDHGGNACTSGTTPVTVKACANADCTALYLDNVTVDLTPNAGGGRTWTPAEPVTFSGGSVDLTLANTTANTQTLGGTATSPTAGNATRCFNGATETCSLTFSACTFDALEVSLPTTNRVIYTKLANTAFDLSVLSLSGANQTVNTVELVNASSGTCSTFPSLGSSSTTVPSSFTGNQRKTFSFTYADAAPNVLVRLTNSASVKSCSSDNFAIRPQAFAVTSNATQAGNIGLPIFRAGMDPFSLTAAAGYSGYTGIPRLNASLIFTSLANLGIVTTATFPAAASGVSTASGFKYDEVGNFNLAQYAVYDDAFAMVDSVKGECIPGFSNVLDGNGKYSCQFGSAAAGVFGRFVPDHFDTAVVLSAGVPMPCLAGINPATSLAWVCPASNDLQDGFVYSGQPFSVKVSARNTSTCGGVEPDACTTKNYQDVFAKAVTLSAAATKGGVVIATGGAGEPTFAPTAVTGFSGGVVTINGVASPIFTFAATLTAPTDIYVRAADTDGVISQRTPNPTSIEGGVKVVSGRIRIVNAHGSELLPLPMTATVQYYNGTYWATSVTDSITSLTLGDGNYQYKTGSWTVMPPANVMVSAGVLNYKLSSGGGTGSVNISASAPIYFLTGSNGAGVNPSNTGRATFGVYKGNEEFIYLREMY